jgi:hypothetical protein
VLIGTNSTYSDNDDVKFELNVTSPGIVKGFFCRRFIFMNTPFATIEEYHWESTIDKCLPLIREGLLKFMKNCNRVKNTSFPVPWTCQEGQYWELVMSQATFAFQNSKVL